ncbi:MAG: MFS transporter [Chthoniobacteraceae bacterium]
MSSPTTLIPQPIDTPPEKIYSIGTLRYNQNALYILFFWLMWNDFGITLIEQIGGLGSFLMLDRGATYTQMALMGAPAALIFPWINPWVSTWSDRHRGKWGRRRPFLLFAAPFFAFFMAVYPFMPDLFRILMHHQWMVALSAHFPIRGDILFMGISSQVSGIFNSVLMAIFLYLYWDVVPESVLGRFQSLSKIVTLLAGLVWSFFIFGQGQTGHHPKAVYVCTSIFGLAIYMGTTWMIKEGEYPPPDVHKKGGKLAIIRAYFVECYSQPYYLWIFVASLLYQLGNQGGGYQTYYLRYDLHMDLDVLGWTGGWVNTITSGFGMIFGFYIGVITDRLKPMRLMCPLYLLMALGAFGAYFFVHDKWSNLYWSVGRTLIIFPIGIVVGAFTAEIFPREKLGQFCSAQAVFYQFFIAIVGPFIAMLFDHIHYNRLGYLWSAFFYALGALAYLKVYWNWKARHGQTPVPHAG